MEPLKGKYSKRKLNGHWHRINFADKEAVAVLTICGKRIVVMDTQHFLACPENTCPDCLAIMEAK